MFLSIFFYTRKNKSFGYKYLITIITVPGFVREYFGFLDKNYLDTIPSHIISTLEMTGFQTLQVRPHWQNPEGI